MGKYLVDKSKYIFNYLNNKIVINDIDGLNYITQLLFINNLTRNVVLYDGEDFRGSLVRNGSVVVIDLYDVDTSGMDGGDDLQIWVWLEGVGGGISDVSIVDGGNRLLINDNGSIVVSSAVNLEGLNNYVSRSGLFLVNLNSGVDDVYLVSGGDLVLCRFKGTVEGGNDRFVFYLYESSSGVIDSNSKLISIFFLNSGYFFEDLNVVVSSGKYVITRLRKLDGGARQMFFKWEGYKKNV